MKMINKVTYLFLLMFISLSNIQSAKAAELTESTFCVSTSEIWQFVGYGLFALKILIPLIIIIFGIIDFAKAMTSRDDDGIKKSSLAVARRLIAGVIIFFLPTVINVIFDIISNVANLEGIDACRVCLLTPFNQTCDDYVQTAAAEREEQYNDPAPGGVDMPEIDTPSTGDGNILILAGHSYEPYCSRVSNECRGVWPSSGYDETEETRKLARALKAQLNAIGVSADIANELLSPGDSRMSTSFFVERSLNTDIFNQYDWSSYDYAIELHFNGSNGGGASGTVVVLNSGYQTTAIDSELVSTVTRFTGNANRGYTYVNTGNFSYFQRIGVPFTYLEVEFYDNKTAMDKYTQNMSNIAAAMAQVIKKYYG